MICRCLALIMTCAVASTVQAGDGGDLSLRLMTQHEAALLNDPGVDYGSSGPSFVYLPRFEFHLAYGLAHWLEVFIGGSLSLPRDVVTRGVEVQAVHGQLRSTYQDVLVPFGVTARWDRGTSYSWALMASTGPSLTHWAHNELRKDLGVYPIEATRTWRQEWMVQGAVLGQWRPSDWFALSGGPYVRRTTCGDTHLGLSINMEFLAGVGPSW
jgi:hypothetical protein